MADLPKPALIVTVTGRLVETEPTVLTFDLPDGKHELCTADQLRDYAAAKVAEERERWAHVFDGWRVLQELTPEQRKRIGYADVSDVLDAVARLSRAAAIRGTEAASRGE